MQHTSRHLYIPPLMPDVVMHLFVNPLEINKGRRACFDLRDQKG